jgi:hypothetical protein
MGTPGKYLIAMINGKSKRGIYNGNDEVAIYHQLNLLPYSDSPW